MAIDWKQEFIKLKDEIREAVNEVTEAKTGAERYLAERMSDPEYAAAYADALTAERDALAATLVDLAPHANAAEVLRLAESLGVVAEEAWPEVPDGHEVVVLPSEVVDQQANVSDYSLALNPVLRAACRATVAARPAPPAPETEWVHWSDLPGQTLTNGKHVTYVRRSAEGRIDYTSGGPGGSYWHLRDVAPDGTVKVLAGDGES